jgi:MFS family permease
MTNTGAIIMGVFAAIWWLVGVRASGHGSPLTYGIALLVTGMIVVAAWRGRHRFEQASPEEDARRGRLVGIASGGEGLAIFLAMIVLGNLGLSDYAAPVIAIIVGLHFVPLARWLPARLYYGTSALLIVLGVCGFAIRAPDRRLLIVSIGAACVLWLTCALVLSRARIMRDHERETSAV